MPAGNITLASIYNISILFDILKYKLNIEFVFLTAQLTVSCGILSGVCIIMSGIKVLPQAA
jgi:hypothetical protein